MTAITLTDGLVLTESQANALFTAAQAEVGPDLTAYFDSLSCEICGDVGFNFRGPHSGGCYTVKECDCRLIARLGLSPTQVSGLKRLYPRLSLASAYDLWQTRLAMRRRLAEQYEEAKRIRDFEGDRTALDLARNGYWDVHFEEFVGSETFGPKPRWIETVTHRASEVRVSPNSLVRALFSLAVARIFPTIRANALRNAKIQLQETWFVADGYRDVMHMDDGTDDRDMGPDVLAWLHRDPSNRAILNRWHRPIDELEFMDRLREEGRENEWWELMVDFRRRKLDTLLKEYFGLDDYRTKMIVLKWETTSTGRFRPAHQMNVVDWVKLSCEQSGSILGGLQSCTRSIQVKQQLRKRKEKKAEAQDMTQDEMTTHAWA